MRQHEAGENEEQVDAEIAETGQRRFALPEPADVKGDDPQRRDGAQAGQGRYVGASGQATRR
jgi:hypothetical protein